MRILATTALCFALFLSAGCGAVLMGGGAALGTYAYVNGDATGTYDATLNKAFEATKDACGELGIPITKEEMDKSSARILGKFNGDTVTISLDLVGMDITEITVRVGLWGNEASSRRIHNGITMRL